MKAAVHVDVDIQRTARVQQLEGLFAVPPSKRAELQWDVDLPLDAQPWNIGLIVGPSGSGKTTVTRALWPEYLARSYDWPADRSVLDGFPQSMGIKEIIDLLSSVGFSSPPAWLRPYRVLSTGEQFRVDMARVLAESAFAVVDEFTSVVDRTVAQIGSAALARTIRRSNRQFVAVTCHEDVLDWLQPDWVYRPELNEFHWRHLQRRPAIDLEIFRVHREAWQLFRHTHYLDTSLNPSALCFVALWRNIPVAFVAAVGFPHAVSPGYRMHRLVCLPDYQGVGIGMALCNYVSSALVATGRAVHGVTGHPAVLGHFARSTGWKMQRTPGLNSAMSKSSRFDLRALSKTVAIDRMTAGFRYVGPSLSRAEASRFLGNT